MRYPCTRKRERDLKTSEGRENVEVENASSAIAKRAFKEERDTFNISIKRTLELYKKIEIITMIDSED